MKYLSSFWGTLEMPLIDCVITLDINWSKNCVIGTTNVEAQATIFSMTNTSLYVAIVTLSIQDYTKLLEQSKSEKLTGINIK